MTRWYARRVDKVSSRSLKPQLLCTQRLPGSPAAHKLAAEGQHAAARPPSWLDRPCRRLSLVSIAASVRWRQVGLSLALLTGRVPGGPGSPSFRSVATCKFCACQSRLAGRPQACEGTPEALKQLLCSPGCPGACCCDGAARQERSARAQFSLMGPVCAPAPAVLLCSCCYTARASACVAKICLLEGMLMGMSNECSGDLLVRQAC